MSRGATRHRQGAQDTAVPWSLPMQGSQPSTASPFKQDVFVYSASPGSESPSVGAAATPVIMSRSPTGGSWGHGRVGGHRLYLCSWSPWKPLGSRSGGLGRGLWLWDREAPSPALPGLQAAAEGDGAVWWLCSPWQDGHPAGCGASPHSARSPDPDGAALERHPHVL